MFFQAGFEHCVPLTLRTRLDVSVELHLWHPGDVGICIAEYPICQLLLAGETFRVDVGVAMTSILPLSITYPPWTLPGLNTATEVELQAA